MSWSPNPAKEALARQAAVEAAGMCPNCGADAEVDLIYVGDGLGDDAWIPGTIRCSARCYETDPKAYLAALKART